MSIIHIRKRDNPYVMIDKRPLENEQMSWQAKGMLTYLLSKPANWNVCVEDLINRSKDGKSSVYATLKELEKLGHIVKVAHRENGRITKWIYDVFEEPKSEIPEDESTSRFSRNRKPTSRKSISRKSTTSNNESNNNEFNNNEEADASASKDWNKEFIRVYFEWYQKENGGIDPKLDKGDYAALKTIREYLSASKKGNFEAALQSFEYILQNWAVLKDYRYLHTSKSPKQINSNLVNILPIIREHFEKVTKQKEGTIENPKTLKGNEYYDYYGGLNPNFKQPNQ
jgi:DNA-binding PadR family transcriptional regulator